MSRFSFAELEEAEDRALVALAEKKGTQFTCFTHTKVQLLTPEQGQGLDGKHQQSGSGSARLWLGAAGIIRRQYSSLLNRLFRGDRLLL